ncbi:MAG: PAS domain S-box protein, partial [Dehalococcoidia bacterium]
MSVALREALKSPGRLEALYASDLLDPAPDEAFDRLTRMAAGAIGAAVVCVTATDADWLYFRSQWGFPKGQEPPARQPLEYTACTHVAATDSPVVLADVRQDPRFRDGPAVRDWNVVAYAGVPLHAPGGEAIGTLSAIDHQPREWAVAELQVLLDYAALLETELASRAELARQSAAQAALQRSEQRYRQLFDNANDGLVTTDLDGTITDVNESALRSSGRPREDLIGSSLFDLMTGAGFVSPLQSNEPGAPQGRIEGFDALMQRAAAGEKVVVPDVRFSVRQTGRSGWMTGTFTPLRGPDGEITGVIARFSDTTERKRTELALIQAQKMESLGVLAGGVAHDFNNLLTAILGFAGLLKRSPGLSRSETDNLNLIESAARRGAELTGRLLAFARGGLVRFVPLDMRDVVAETLQLAEPGMHSNLLVRSDVGETAVMVEGDHGQLQQALLNIVLNARDAMPGGGRLSI